MTGPVRIRPMAPADWPTVMAGLPPGNRHRGRHLRDRGAVVGVVLHRASIALHAAAGFRVLCTRRRLGRAADGRWRDVVLVERRSAVVGVEPPAATE